MQKEYLTRSPGQTKKIGEEVTIARPYGCEKVKNIQPVADKFRAFNFFRDNKKWTAYSINNDEFIAPIESVAEPTQQTEQTSWQIYERATTTFWSASTCFGKGWICLR